MMYGDPASWNALLTVLGSIVQAHLRAQVAAGAQALQVFDSWVGAIAPDDYARYVFPTMRDLFESLADLDVPTIHFGVGTAELLVQMRRAGGDVVGIDWRTPLDVGWERVGHDVGIQGNLDPVTLLAPWDVVEDRALAVIERANGRPGHVFNLGHGVLPSTPPDTLARLVDLVHVRTERAGPGPSPRRPTQEEPTR
jgi:uroporphyrinogen decarboxylase